MTLSKQEADFFARSFRAELNKAARDRLRHQAGFYSEKYTVEFEVKVTPKDGKAKKEKP